jgi:ketosteroid isomerase-like protein
MPGRHVEVVRRTNQALNRRDWDTWLDAFHPNLVYHDHGAREVTQIVRGREVLMALLLEWIATFDDLERHIEELVDAGDYVVSIGRWRGTGRGSGALRDFPETIVWAFREGRILEGWALSSREDAMALAGLVVDRS